MNGHLISGLLLLAGISSAQSTRPEDLAQGKILVMNRHSTDPLFARSVIVLARYSKASALGLMLHYRSKVPIRQALDGIKGADKRTDALFVGGPVEIPGVMALLRSRTAPPGAGHVTGNLYLLSAKPSLETALTESHKPSDLRIFVGYAGWGPGQLENEVRMNGWYIFNYDENVVFDLHPETLWKRLIDKAEARKVSLPKPPRTALESPARAANSL